MSGPTRSVVLYLLLLLLLLLVAAQSGYPGILDQASFLGYDAAHYHWISQHGYAAERVAFFPLFPLLWRFLEWSPQGMALLNACIFGLAAWRLLRLLQANEYESWLLLSLPGAIFYVLPYTESIFFAASVLILEGLMRQKTGWAAAGMLLASLSRPAFTVFVPAVLFMEIWGLQRNGRRLALYIGSMLAGACVVAWIQYLDTGEWFRFFAAQKAWGNALQVPRLPLRSWAGGVIVRLDGTALLVGVIAGGVLLRYGWLRWQGRGEALARRDAYLFSLLYLAGISASVLLFRGGSLFSLNRFVFCTAFMWMALFAYLRAPLALSHRQLWYIFGGIFAFWLFFHSFLHIRVLLMYTLLSLCLLLVAGLKSAHPGVARFSALALPVINVVFQGHLLLRFLQGEWVA